MSFKISFKSKFSKTSEILFSESYTQHKISSIMFSSKLAFIKLQSRNCMIY